jgi:hypothetical protein
MPYHRLWRLIQGQGGSTIIELLLAMPIAVILLGIVTQGLGVAGRSGLDVQRRAVALTQGQIGLERMTRELRQARWVYFRSSTVVDVEAQVRPGPAASSVNRLVRYDCSGTSCVRSEGPAVAYPPPAQPAFSRSTVVVGRPPGDKGTRYGTVVGHDVFEPTRIDGSGHGVVDYADPDTLQIRLRLRVEGRRGPVELRDGISLRNRSTFR